MWIFLVISGAIALGHGRGNVLVRHGDLDHVRSAGSHVGDRNGNSYKILWDLVSKSIYTADVFCEDVGRCGVWFPLQDKDKPHHCLGEGQE